MLSSRPYLVRALYDWIVDSGMTPYVLVDAANDEARVPQQYAEDGKIVLNLSPQATEALDIQNDYVMFNARFSGQPMNVSFPMQAVLAIYAKENGQGMVFQDEDGGGPDSPTDPDKPTRPKLKLVK